MRWTYLCAAALAAVCGCGKPTLHPAQGEVRFASVPAAGVRVFFWPESPGDHTPNTRVGTAVTDAAGRFSIKCYTGEEGLERGAYRVTFSRPSVKGKAITTGKRADGAVEGVPMPYSDHNNPGNSPATASLPSSGDLVFEIPAQR
jgi:hypothetical protein